jgi:hypothetical protein
MPNSVELNVVMFITYLQFLYYFGDLSESRSGLVVLSEVEHSLTLVRGSIVISSVIALEP